MNIVLIGFMGTGKSTIGRKTAERLGWPFFDTDAMIEKEIGLSIPQIFAKQGEPAFRELEAQSVRLVASLDKAVIATGGGAPLRKDNMDALEKNGHVVLLSARPKTILKRLKGKIQTRPLLAGEDPEGLLEELMDKRRDAYARAKTVIETDGLTPDQVVERVVALAPGRKPA